MSNDSEKLEIIKKHINSYPDFPKNGVLFRDIFSVLLVPSVFTLLKEVLISSIKKNFSNVECIAALDARGFLFGPLISLDLQIPFVPIRKSGKLPGNVISEEYSKEYGKVCVYISKFFFPVSPGALDRASEDTLQMQEHSIKSGVKVLLVDDLLATGGSLEASCKLIQRCDAEVVGCLVIMELEDFKGASRINVPLHSLIKY